MSSRVRPITQVIRAERRARALKMQEEYDKLSLQEKIARLPKVGAKKQRAKLEALLEKQSEKTKKEDDKK
jgi:hypothetical protein